MAKQHFYSRVPAKMSMYNRTDGYDTFAHSQGLERGLIEKDLAPIYENKLNKTNMEDVRKGLLPRVYSQTCLRSGEVVQSCVTYLPRDYTGERSAYLCHSLILGDQERQMLCTSGSSVLNPEMFPIFDTKFLSGESSANDHYPETDYVGAQAEDPAAVLAKHDPDQIADFVFALLSVFFAKGKTVYFSLPCEDLQASDEALRFLSAVMSVIPRRARAELSFASFVTEPGQYASAKIKCMSHKCSEVPVAKGIFFDFATGYVTGLPSRDTIEKAPVEFFCSLLKNAAEREEFLLFIERAMDSVSKLDKLNLKTLTDLVFLFGGASNLYHQETVLPTDGKVYDLLCVYEKYRDALSEESRRYVYKCLERYPQNHVAIPKNIFSKVSKLYPGEPDSVKRVVMHVVLDLIHTDIMREKLFVFIKNNYDGEDADIQALIVADLCRVFYGGFLQIPILTFFREHFVNEPEEIQYRIFEKLMLTIRTEAVQQPILEFVGENYHLLSQRQKDLFYDTFFEMLPEADALAGKLVQLTDQKLENETAEIQARVHEGLTALLEKAGRRQDHDLLIAVCSGEGFCYDTVTELAFGQWRTRKIFTDYLQLLLNKPVVARTEALFRIHRVLSGMDQESQSKLIQVLDQLFPVDEKAANLYHWLEADRIAEGKMATEQKALAYMFRVKITRPALENTMMDVFNVRLGKDGLERICRYAENNREIQDTKAYKVVQVFRYWQDAAIKQDPQVVFRCLKQLPPDTALRNQIAGYIRACVMKVEEGGCSRVLQEMSACYLGKGVLLSEEIYPQLRGELIQPLLSHMKGPKAVKEGACQSMKKIFSYLSAACGISEEFMGALYASEDTLRTMLMSFANDYGNGAAKWVHFHLHGAPEKLVTLVDKLQNEAKPAPKPLWAKLFGK